jgi:hypothetical protein
MVFWKGNRLLQFYFFLNRICKIAIKICLEGGQHIHETKASSHCNLPLRQFKSFFNHLDIVVQKQLEHMIDFEDLML